MYEYWLLTVTQDIIIPITKFVEVEYLMQRLVGTQWQ